MTKDVIKIKITCHNNFTVTVNDAAPCFVVGQNNQGFLVYNIHYITSHSNMVKLKSQLSENYFVTFTLMTQLSKTHCYYGKQVISKQWRKNCHKSAFHRLKQVKHLKNLHSTISISVEVLHHFLHGENVCVQIKWSHVINLDNFKQKEGKVQLSALLSKVILDSDLKYKKMFMNKIGLALGSAPIGNSY